MKREQRFFLIWRYVTFFLLIAFVITCSFFLFFHSMELDEELIRRNAPLAELLWHIIGRSDRPQRPLPADNAIFVVIELDQSVQRDFLRVERLLVHLRCCR